MSSHVVVKLPAVRAFRFGLFWLAAWCGARIVLELPEVSTVVRIAAALAPVPLFLAFLVHAVRAVRDSDELQRRIQAETLAITLCLLLVLLTTLALMQRAVTLNMQDWSYSHVVAFIPIFYVGALTYVRRRYGSE